MINIFFKQILSGSIGILKMIDDIWKRYINECKINIANFVLKTYVTLFQLTCKYLLHKS